MASSQSWRRTVSFANSSSQPQPSAERGTLAREPSRLNQEKKCWLPESAASRHGNHKVVHHPARPGRLFLQNHWGLYRSDDWGDTWADVANGVPSDFGFAMQTHPHDL